MSIENNSMTEGLAKIVREEAQLNFGINRYLLAVISLGVFLGGLYILSPYNLGAQKPDTFALIMGPGLMIFSFVFAFGAWRANAIHNKLKALHAKNGK